MPSYHETFRKIQIAELSTTTLAERREVLRKLHQILHGWAVNGGAIALVIAGDEGFQVGEEPNLLLLTDGSRKEELRSFLFHGRRRVSADEVKEDE